MKKFKKTIYNSLLLGIAILPTILIPLGINGKTTQVQNKTIDVQELNSNQQNISKNSSISQYSTDFIENDGVLLEHKNEHVNISSLEKWTYTANMFSFLRIQQIEILFSYNFLFEEQRWWSSNPVTGKPSCGNYSFPKEETKEVVVDDINQSYFLVFKNHVKAVSCDYKNPIPPWLNPPTTTTVLSSYTGWFNTEVSGDKLNFYFSNTNNQKNNIDTITIKEINISYISLEIFNLSKIKLFNTTNIKNYFENTKAFYLSNEWTYLDLENKFKEIIDENQNPLELIPTSYIDIDFYDGFTLLDKNSNIVNANLYFRIRSNNLSSKVINQSSWYNLFIPFVNMKFDNVENSNVYGNSSNSNDIFVKNNSGNIDIYLNEWYDIELYDSNIEYIKIGDDILINENNPYYEFGFYTFKNNLNKDAFHIKWKNGIEKKYVFHYQQRSYLHNILNNGNQAIKNLFINNQNGEIINGVSIDTSNTLNIEIIKDNSKYRKFDIYENTSNNLVSNINEFGVFRIEFLDNFGNDYIEYIEIHNNNPQFLTTLFSSVNQGKDYYKNYNNLNIPPLLDNTETFNYVNNSFETLFNIEEMTLSEFNEEILIGSKFSENKHKLEEEVLEKINNQNSNITPYIKIEWNLNDEEIIQENQEVELTIKPKYSSRIDSENLPIFNEGNVKGIYKNTFKLNTLKSYDLSLVNFETNDFTKISETNIQNKTFGDLRNTLNDQVYHQIQLNNQQGTISFERSDIKITWIGSVNYELDRIVLNDDVNLKDLTNKTVTFIVESLSRKVINFQRVNVVLNLYERINISDTKINPSRVNEIAYIWQTIQDYDHIFRESIINEINSKVYKSIFTDPLTINNISNMNYEYGLDYQFQTTGWNMINGIIEVNSRTYSGKLSFTVEIFVLPKIQSITDSNINSEDLFKNKLENLNLNLSKKTKLSEINREIEDAIVEELNSQFMEFKHSNNRISHEDLNFVYSHDLENTIEKEFHIEVSQKNHEEEPLIIEFDFYSLNIFSQEIQEIQENQTLFWVLTLFISFTIIFSIGIILKIKKNKNE